MIWGRQDEFVARSRQRRRAAFRATPALLFSLALIVPSYAAAAENEDVAALRRMLGELKAENRKLSQRLSALEGASATPRVKPAPAQQRPAPAATSAAVSPTVVAPTVIVAQPVASPVLP